LRVRSKGRAGGKRLKWYEFLKLVEKQPPEGCFAFCGPEMFLKHEGLEALKRSLLGSASGGQDARYAVDTFRAGETGCSEIASAASQAGLFGAERLVLVEEFERLGRVRGKEREAWIALAGSCPPNPLIFTSQLTSRELSDRSRFLADLLRQTLVVEFWHLFPRDAARWVREKAKREGLSCSPEAAGTLVGHIGPDLLLLAREIEKISLLRGEGTLGVEDLRDLVRRGLLGSSWECVEAGIAGRLREAVERLQAVRREESAFSFAWKLGHATRRRLLGESGGSATGAWGASRSGESRFGSVETRKISAAEQKLLGRLLCECYLWERNLKGGFWSGAHDYVALEAVLVGHAVRCRAARAPSGR
jgi:DNA polymerase III delta subunit